jgi:hypothetical protein
MYLFEIILHIIEHLVKTDKFFFVHSITPDTNMVERSINKFV